MPAKGKEIIFDSYLLHSQHFLPDFNDFLLYIITRLLDRCVANAVWIGKRLAVNLAVWCLGQGL